MLVDIKRCNAFEKDAYAEYKIGRRYTSATIYGHLAHENLRMSKNDIAFIYAHIAHKMLMSIEDDKSLTKDMLFQQRHIHRYKCYEEAAQIGEEFKFDMYTIKDAASKAVHTLVNDLKLQKDSLNENYIFMQTERSIYHKLNEAKRIIKKYRLGKLDCVSLRNLDRKLYALCNDLRLKSMQRR